MGIGTGHYLAAYPGHANVVGVDLSKDMLDIAAREIEMQGWRHIALKQMNALDLQFAANTFDYVMGFHTASVVDDPQRLMEEMVRVCKPGGTIVIINYFRTQNPWLAPLVDVVSSFTELLGWQTQVKYDDLFENPQIRVQDRYKTSSWSLFTIVVSQKLGRADIHDSQSQNEIRANRADRHTTCTNRFNHSSNQTKSGRSLT
ncbi:MAG: class I SAM-dependent methyltransferase [Planctomycetes bacterium]|nr:class I SAM-dependent methyltransferase [Planctomycetota bacterium]